MNLYNSLFSGLHRIHNDCIMPSTSSTQMTRLDCWHAWNFKGLPLDQVDLIWKVSCSVPVASKMPRVSAFTCQVIYYGDW